MPIVNTSVPITSQECSRILSQLVETYPFCRTELLTRSAFQRPVQALILGTGPRKVLYSAAHHANEWITALLLLKFAEDACIALSQNGTLFGQNAQALFARVTVYLVPMVNPDGVDLVVGAIPPGDIQYDLAQRLAQNYPSIPFPQGWKANLLGVDLNLNYPAGWLQAREIKFSQGFTTPGPRDYVGRAPLNQLETRALADYTESVDPALVLAFHSQGKEIYWTFRDYDVPGARELGEQLAQVSGYTLTEPAFNSSFAGYKDWFIQQFRRPGYTVEVGQGQNPLPLSQFDEIYRDNLGILVTAAFGGTADTAE